MHHCTGPWVCETVDLFLPFRRFRFLFLITDGRSALPPIARPWDFPSREGLRGISNFRTSRSINPYHPVGGSLYEDKIARSSRAGRDLSPRCAAAGGWGEAGEHVASGSQSISLRSRLISRRVALERGLRRQDSLENGI